MPQTTRPVATVQGTPGRILLVINGRVIDQFASVRVAAAYALDVYGLMPNVESFTS